MTQSPGDSTGIREKANAPRASAWRLPTLGPLIGVVLLLVIAYRGLLVRHAYSRGLGGLFDSWFFIEGSDGGGVVIVLALWVLYRRWPALCLVPHRRGSITAIAICFSGAVAILGWAIYARSSDLLAPSLVLACLSLAILRGGAQACRVLTLPLVMLLFAIPMPPPLYNVLVWKAQLWTATSAGWLLEAVGIQATVSADLIFRDRHVLSVIEGCSGLRGAEILMLLALLMKELFRLRTSEGLLLFAVAPAIGFALNGVRVAGIAMLPNPDESIQHTGQGILTLIGGCLVLFGLVLLIERLRGGPDLGGAPDVPTASLTKPTREQRRAGAALLSTLVILSFVFEPAPPAPRAKVGLETLIPTQVGPLEASDLEISSRYMGQALFRETIRRRYGRPGAPDAIEIEFFAGIGARDDRRFSSLSDKTATPGSGWIVEEWTRGTSTLGDARLDILVARAGTARRLVHRFTTGDLGLATETFRAFTGVDGTPFRNASDEIVVRISTPLRNGSTAERRVANARLAGFAQALHEPLNELLREDGAAKPFAAAGEDT